MSLAPFMQVDRILAARETRTVMLLETFNGVPAGSYGFFEWYCVDPNCDCRRVLIQVVEKENPRRVLASIGYGFDREAENAGPFLDPLNEQSPYAEALLLLVMKHALSDPLYVARLKEHYAHTKRAVVDPAHPAYERLRDKPAPAVRRVPKKRRKKR